MTLEPDQMSAARRPTMKDVAARANVSLKTVSRAINNAPNIDPALLQRVLDAVAELGFRRNDMARFLRSGATSAMVGLIIEDIGNPFYSLIASGVAKVARQHDALLMTASLEESPERERELTLQLCQRRVDGLLIVPAGNDHAFLRPEMQMGMHAVFLDRPPTGITADVVLLDNAGGSQAGVELLLAHGHQRVAVLLDSLSIYTMRERLAGAKTAFLASGIPYDETLTVTSIHGPDEALRAAAVLLEGPDPPTAFFCGNNRITIGVLQAVTERVQPIKVVGFDDFELSRLIPAPFTVISYDAVELGRAAAELLYRRIAGDRSRPKTVVVPTQLIDRGTPARG